MTTVLEEKVEVNTFNSTPVSTIFRVSEKDANLLKAIIPNNVWVGKWVKNKAYWFVDVTNGVILSTIIRSYPNFEVSKNKDNKFPKIKLKKVGVK